MIVSHLVTRLYESADKTGDDHDFVNQDGVEYCRPWHSSGQEQVE